MTHTKADNGRKKGGPGPAKRATRMKVAVLTPAAAVAANRCEQCGSPLANEPTWDAADSTVGPFCGSGCVETRRRGA